jgi:hypothetical protein
MANEMIDPDRVRKETDALIEMITDPAFVAAMKRMKETPLDERLDLAKKTLTVDALKRQGVKVPPDMRITTRYFEADRPEVIEALPTGVIQRTVKNKVSFPIDFDLNPGRMQAGGCACGGAGGVCGGAGWT